MTSFMSIDEGGGGNLEQSLILLPWSDITMVFRLVLHTKMIEL